ncbi:MAG: hypothetical protein JNJ88_04635 [Planctomycetes bacterium]|nr:hypothetical protein [Planctomycetota bacterium]
MVQNPDSNARGMSPIRKLVLSAIVLIFVGSILLRFSLGSDAPQGGPAGSTGLAPSSAAPSGSEGGAGSRVAEFLPYFTEGSFCALIGFALGFASRKVVKVGLVLLGLFSAAVFGLSAADVVQVDWSKATELMNGLILNLREAAGWADSAVQHLPSAGAFLGGYLFGYRRG